VIGFGRRKEARETARKAGRSAAQGPEPGGLPSAGDPNARDEYVRYLIPKDLMEFGLIPEFIGRLPVVSTLETLRQHDLVRILTEPRNALVRQYQALFEINGKKLDFTPDALEAIADIAIDRETGVRALRSILEDRLLDLLYELPSRKDCDDFLVDRAVVYGEKTLARGLTTADLDDEVEADDDEAATGDPEQTERESA